MSFWIMAWLGLVACNSPSLPLPTRATIATVPSSLTSTPTLPPPAPIVPTWTPLPTQMTVSAALPSPTPTPCSETGRIETGVLHSQVAGALAYRIYLPPCYREDGRYYPTLYMLPGNNQTDAIWDDLGLDETAETAIQNNEIPPLLIVMPDGGRIARDTSGGTDSYETVILEDLIPVIEASYCAWPDAAGRAIGGVSRGGYWALEIAFRHPEAFTSVGGHSASLLDVAAGPELNPQHTGLNNDLGDLRVYLDIGADDGGIHNTSQLHEDMADRNIPHTWALGEGGHDALYWSTHLTEYLTWYAAPWPLKPDQYPSCSPK